MTRCQISLAVMHLFLAFVFRKQEIWSEGTYYKKSSNAVLHWKKKVATTRDLLYKIEHKYITSWHRNLRAMFVWEELKTLCWLSKWIQRSIEENAGSGEGRAELRRLSRRLQSVIKVSSWRLYNFYNQQEAKSSNQKSSSTIWSLLKRNLCGRRLKSISWY